MKPLTQASVASVESLTPLTHFSAVFYTKYRPQKFSELFGLESTVKILSAQIKKGEIGHAYLFAGPRGTGKTTVARILAREAGCRGMDLIEIDAASNRGIDDIRNLREKIGLAPSAGQKKVYIIDEVHMLTREAFNALLKTLEEPPAHAILVLCTTEPEKVPETVRSRCQRFDFKRASTQDIVKKLQLIVKKERANISTEDLELIAKNAEGGFRDAETMLEQVVVGGAAAKDVVGLAAGETVGEFVDFLLEGKTAEALKFVNKLYDEGVNLESFAKTLLEYLRGMILVSVGVGEELLEAPEEVANRIKSQVSKVSEQKLKILINEFTQAAENISKSAIPQLPLEMAIVRVAEAGSWKMEGGEDAGRSKMESSDEETSSPQPPASHPAPNFKPPAPTASTEKSSTSDIVGKWDAVLAKVKPYNHSLEALLRSCRPLKIEDNILHIEAFYKFHKERLEEIKNRSVLEKVLNELTGMPLKVRAFLGKKEAAPKSTSSKKRSSQTAPEQDFEDSVDLDDEAVEVFNGEL